MGAKKSFKKTHGGWPPMIYVKREEDGRLKYFACGETVEELPFVVGERADIGTYTFSGHVEGEAVVQLKMKDKMKEKKA